METRKPLKIPPQLILLDVIGAFLAAVGLAKYFAGVDLLPQAFRFANYDAILILVGFALMMPLIFHLVGQARERAQR